VHTPSELEALLQNKDFAKDDKIRLVEVYMPRGDAPEELIRQGKLTAKANAESARIGAYESGIRSSTSLVRVLYSNY
jgi:hypothetical protein